MMKSMLYNLQQRMWFSEYLIHNRKHTLNSIQIKEVVTPIKHLLKGIIEGVDC